MDGAERIARLTGAGASEVRKELWRARRRSEPDAREVYGLIRGYRFVGRLRGSGWEMHLEARPAAWERINCTGWL